LQGRVGGGSEGEREEGVVDLLGHVAHPRVHAPATCSGYGPVTPGLPADLVALVAQP
jgi:hypothetical protein